MDRDSPLPTLTLDSGASLIQASPWNNRPVTPDSPALEVVTDLAQVKAATVAPEQSLRQAEQAMVYLGVRMLFVVSHMPALEGLITSTDLHGERQMRLVAERGLPYDELRVLGTLRTARVGNLVATLKRFGRNHLLVVDGSAGTTGRVCGIVSRSQIERQLGIPVAVTDIANSFSEIERALL
jgi:CBS-domain-containing membrane protein